MSKKQLKLRPLGDRVLLRQVNAKKEKSPILLPEDAESSHEFLEMEVLSISKSTYSNGISKGDHVLLPKHSGMKLEMDEQVMRVVEIKEIFAVVG